MEQGRQDHASRILWDMWRRAIERQQHAVGHGQAATRNPIMPYFMTLVQLNISDVTDLALPPALPAGFTAIFLMWRHQ